MTLASALPSPAADLAWDLLLIGGHVVDAGNGLSAVRDVAIVDGRIAAVAPSLDPARALKLVDVSGLYVTPGLVDIHTHAYAGELGHLSVGAIADVAVLKLESGRFGLIDAYGARLDGKQKLGCELTLKDGRVVYDLNGLSREAWDTLPGDYTMTGDPRWDGIWR